MSNLKMFVCCAVAAVAAISVHTQASAVTVTPGDSGDPWLGHMGVYNYPDNFNGALSFETNNWFSGVDLDGMQNLRTTFDDVAETVTLQPNTGTINSFTGEWEDAPYWWGANGGQPGSPGNKIMEASLYQEVTGSLAGQTVEFTFNVLSDTTTDIFYPDTNPWFPENTPTHTGFAFIRDVPDGPAQGYCAEYDEILNPNVQPGQSLGPCITCMDGADFLAWQRGFGATDVSWVGYRANGDFTNDGNVDSSDLAVWEANYGRHIVKVPITGGVQTISLDTIDDPTRIVSYGFMFHGRIVWHTDLDQFGSIVISTGDIPAPLAASAVPEPSSLVLLAIGLLGLGLRKR